MVEHDGKAGARKLRKITARLGEYCVKMETGQLSQYLRGAGYREVEPGTVERGICRSTFTSSASATRRRRRRHLLALGVNEAMPCIVVEIRAFP